MVADEELGSELSGISAEIPDEIDNEERSANYLVHYARHYKSDLLEVRQKRSRGQHKFKSIKVQARE